MPILDTPPEAPRRACGGFCGGGGVLRHFMIVRALGAVIGGSELTVLVMVARLLVVGVREGGVARNLLLGGDLPL